MEENQIIAALEGPVVAPVEVNTGGENLSFIDNFKSRFGVDVPDEVAAFEMVNQWKSQTDVAAQMKAQLEELQNNRVEHFIQAFE